MENSLIVVLKIPRLIGEQLVQEFNKLVYNSRQSVIAKCDDFLLICVNK